CRKEESRVFRAITMPPISMATVSVCATWLLSLICLRARKIECGGGRPELIGRAEPVIPAKMMKPQRNAAKRAAVTQDKREHVVRPRNVLAGNDGPVAAMNCRNFAEYLGCRGWGVI